MYEVDEHYNMIRRIERLNDFNDKMRLELNSKLNLLNKLYLMAFPGYVPEGKPRYPGPFTGDPVNDAKYEAELVRKFKKIYVETV